MLLDNLAQVADAAPVLGTLLAAAPRLPILATSRTTLHVYGEHVVPVAPLPLPSRHPLPPLPVLAQVDAIALFVQRARAVAPECAICTGNGAVVAAIWVRLDRLLWALELAAARMAIFSPQMLLARFDSCLDILTGGPGDQPARPRTLRAALAWSYDLLSPAEQQLCRRFAVFAGGGALDAVEHVCAGACDAAEAPGAIAGLVEQLVHKSFISAVQEAGGEPRFTMLETVRACACCAFSGAAPLAHRYRASPGLGRRAAQRAGPAPTHHRSLPL